MTPLLFKNIRGKTMVRQKSKRHLSFEQLDARIAMNSDSYPLRLIGFDLPQRSFGGGIEVRGFSKSVGEATPVQQVVIARTLPKYDFILLNLRPFGKMMGEGEGKSGPDHTIHSPPPHASGSFFAEGELQLKPSTPVRSADQPNGPTATVLLETTVLTATQSGASAAVSRPLQASADTPGQNQNVARLEPSPLKPISLQEQSSTRVAASVIQTASASPLSDSLNSRRDLSSVSVASQSSFLQSKSSLNDLASVPSNAKGLSQTPLVIVPKSESAKPTKDGMLSFAMDINSLRTDSVPPNSVQSNASRSRTPQQNEVLLRQMQRASVDSIIDELAVNAKRLPVPKGMIDVRDREAHLHQGVVAKASANPFEILQLFIGTTNMVQLRSENDAQSPFGISLESSESPEMATREDILVTLGIGAVLAIALRESKQCKQRDPFFATFRRYVAQWT